MQLNTIKRKKQDVGWTTSWKSALSNYKSRINNKKLICRIVRHFIKNCIDNGVDNLRFTPFDWLNNVDGLTSDETDNHHLEKENFLVRTLIKQHYCLNSVYDFNRKNH